MKFLSLFTKKLITVTIAISFYHCAQSQKNTLKEGVIGHWKTVEDQDFNFSPWQAAWIWLPEAKNANMMLARKNFILKKKPAYAILKITASSKYELFINGKAICQGPARSAPHHQSYDILEIQSALSIGANTVAVKVHHQNNKHSYHLKGRAGLLAELNVDDVPIFSTDDTWKVETDPSWDANAPVMNRFQMVVNDRIDFRNKISSWNTLEFDDSQWSNAKTLLRNSGWPAPKKTEKATALTTPWTHLVPREIPYLIEKDTKAIQLIEARTISNTSSSPLPSDKIILKGIIDKKIKKQYKNYYKKNKPIEIPITEKNQTRILVFDMGKVRNGMPKLNIKGDAGTTVHVLAAPFIIDDSFSYKIIDSDYSDKLILSGKEDQWQSMYFKPTRYLALAVHGNTNVIELNYLGIHELKYPFNDIGSINIPNHSWVEQFWDASKKTIDVTTTDAFTDNYRERRQYAQTGYYAALGNYWTFGDTALQRRYLVQVAQEQFANGIMPAYAPLAKDDYMIILDSNCLWIQSLYQYLLYSGDYKTVKELLPAAKKLMSLLHSFTNDDGLITDPPYSYWLDHTLNDRTGANLCLNGHYLGALEGFAKTLYWLEDSYALEFNKRSKKLRKAISENFWNEKKGLFVDAFTNGTQSKKYSEHGNAIALAYKIASPEQAKTIAEQLLENDSNNFVKRKNGMIMVSPAMSYFLHVGLSENGYVTESLDLFKRRFSKMLAPETNQTLWEEWWRDGSGRTGKFIGGRTRSDAQTESAFPPQLFVRYIMGLQLTKPGAKEITIQLDKKNSKSFEAILPTVRGIIELKYTKGKRDVYQIKAPKNTIFTIDTSKLSATEKQNLKLNGKVVGLTNSIQLSSSESYDTLSF